MKNIRIPTHRILVVMGVSGCGKTTVGERIAEACGCIFKEGDELHPAANIEKMRAGEPLTDADRRPWLAAIERWIDAQRRAQASAVITCSALKRRYRQQLLNGREDLRLLYLRASEPLLAERLRQRTNHFMPAALLHSQFEALEEPLSEAAVCVIDAAGNSIDQIVQGGLACLDGGAERSQ